ncbi:MAG: hypothetical protein K6V36_05845 [Anaerolineae bacterium]|nr:hypothetical protein [Anaerolineae bacterium]
MSPYQRQRLIWLTWVLAGFVLCGVLVLRGVALAQTSAQVRHAGPVRSPDNILEAPRQYLHQPVSLEGEIARVLSDRVLALRSRATRKGLLIVLSDEAALHGGPHRDTPLAEGQTVIVLGIVRPLNRQEAIGLEAQYRLGVSSSNLLAGYVDHPYILAYEVRLSTPSTR